MPHAVHPCHPRKLPPVGVAKLQLCKRRSCLMLREAVDVIVSTFCSDCIPGNGREGSSKVGRRLQVDDSPVHMEALQRVFVGTVFVQ